MTTGQPAGPLRPQNPPRTPLARLYAVPGIESSATLVGAVGTSGPDTPTGAARAVDADDTVVTGVTLRAQEVVAGDLFAALPGSRVHGATFAAQAVDRGAAAILTDPDGAEVLATTVFASAGVSVPVLVHDRPRDVLGEISSTIYGDPSRVLTLVGVTGTAGKTTTSYLVESGLFAAGHRAGLIGTVETRIDGRRTPSALTTPEAPDLQALLAVMVERGVDTVVMEVSSHALSLGRVDGCTFAAAGFTNLSQDHLDFHRDMDDYFSAKSRLFAPGSGARAARAVVCVDDAWGRRMARIGRSDPALPTATVTIGQDAAAEWHAGTSEVDDLGAQRFVVRDPRGHDVPVTLPLPGRFNAANALVALGLLEAVGIDVDTASRGLAAVSVPGRLERVDCGQQFLAVVDYAHKPAALDAVIATLRAQSAGRLAVVVGAGGDRDAGKRPLMGAVAARGADLVVVTDDNPRTEDPGRIRTAVLDGALGRDGSPAGPHDEPLRESRPRVIDEGDRAAAIGLAIAWAEPGDTVLVAGKGHETGQEIDGVKHPFDDRDVVAAAIERRADFSRGADAEAAKTGTPPGTQTAKTETAADTGTSEATAGNEGDE